MNADKLLAYMYGGGIHDEESKRMADGYLVQADFYALDFANTVEETPAMAAIGSTFLVFSFIIVFTLILTVLLLVCCFKCFHFWKFVHDLRKTKVVKGRTVSMEQIKIDNSSIV